MSALQDHLKSKLTHVCRCWAITRADGRVFGFTDHDRELSFDGITFKADSGMTARTLEQVTGLAVDNTEAMGALSDISVTEADINAGRFDGAKIEAWLVHWPDVSIREQLFCGSIGELRRADGAFHAELRGLSETLSQPVGQVFQQGCQAVLGGKRCGFDLETPGFRIEVPVDAVERNRVFTFPGFSAFDARWFERGRLEMMGGAAEGLTALIKNDRVEGADRVIELWEELRAPVATGDLVLLEAGCDRRKETCRLKFNNFANFRGFPHIPGEDWLVGYPTKGGRNNGGSRYQWATQRSALSLRPTSGSGRPICIKPLAKGQAQIALDCCVGFGARFMGRSLNWCHPIARIGLSRRARSSCFLLPGGT